MSLLDIFTKRKLSIGTCAIADSDISSSLTISKKLLESIPKESHLFIKEQDPLLFSILFFMSLDLGIIPIMLSPTMPQYQLQEMLLRVQGAFLIEDRKLIVPGRIIKSKYLGCYACLTSGTTSNPKLCYLHKDNARINAKGHAESLGITEQHTLIQSLPLYHSFGIVCYLFCCLEIDFHLNFNKAFLGLRSLKKLNVENGVIYLSPAQVNFINKEKINSIDGIVIASVGGGVIENDAMKRLSMKFDNADLYTTYGLTEAGPRVTSGKWDEYKASGFIGSGIGEIDLKVLDESDQLQDFGFGKLCIKSSSLKLNIDKDELQDDYLITRDHVSLENGEVIFNSRTDDLINIGGISIYPKDIEEVVKRINGVNDCIVLKRKSKKYEEEIVLTVETDLTPKEIDDFVKDKLTVYQRPQQILCYEKLPRFSLNKIDRKTLLSWIENE